jgi:hypothetical protein
MTTAQSQKNRRQGNLLFKNGEFFPKDTEKTKQINEL